MILPPPPADQVRFLQLLQRILAEGGFVATYKFALLHALADLAVLRGDDTGAELPLTTREIAEQMIELYWRQAVPYPTAAGSPVILLQNAGSQAAILSHLGKARQENGHSLARLRRQQAAWKRLVKKVDDVLRAMPLWRLQTVGEERLSFLYENLEGSHQITLRSGVTYCLRAFYPLITDLVRGAWLRFVRERNLSALGERGDLAGFLFGTERQALSVFQPILREVQLGECFYCKRPLPRGGGEVDHFIPWARYPLDLGHNFVLAHASCNRDKSDHLAAEIHLERWLDRNVREGQVLAQRFDADGVPHQEGTSYQVARWAYGQTARFAGQVWVERRRFHALSPGWEALFPPLWPTADGAPLC